MAKFGRVAEPAVEHATPMEEHERHGSARGPRRPDRIKLPVRHRSSPDGQVDEDDLPIQWWAITCIACGMASIFFRSALLGWLACFLLAGHLANLRFGEIDMRQLLAAIAFSGVSIAANYFMVPGGAGQKGAATAPLPPWNFVS